jgi:hypothetical protein
MLEVIIYKWPKYFDMNSDEDFVDVMDILDGIQICKHLDGHLIPLHFNADSFVDEWNRINETTMSADEIYVAIEEYHIWKEMPEQLVTL